MKHTLFLVSLLALFISSSCGKKATGGGSAPQLSAVEPEGVYTATLYPVNREITQKLKSQITITKYGDDFNVRIKFRNGPSGVHMQGLYSGGACPTADPNDDGVTDIIESERDVGHLIIPFDGDLSAQVVGNDFYPSSNDYDYERSTSFNLLISNLDLLDKELQLDGKVILITGVPEIYSLPESAATLGADSIHKTIPIACGVLRLGSNEPGPEPEVIPEPVPPRPEPRPEVRPPPPPEPEIPMRTTIRSRIRARLGSWWRRIRGRSESEYLEYNKPQFY